jgi:hypothetical protein
MTIYRIATAFVLVGILTLSVPPRTRQRDRRHHSVGSNDRRRHVVRVH